MMGSKANSKLYSQITKLTIKALLRVMNPQRRKRFRGSLRLLYRSTLTAKSVKIEVGTVMRYTVIQALHIVFPMFPNSSTKKSFYVKWYSEGHCEKIRERQRENEEICRYAAKVLVREYSVTDQEVSDDRYCHDHYVTRPPLDTRSWLRRKLL
ncbi:hypothetical protein OS493_014646 [Desmophyllum pertusum]|uniref:Uncharacterized protein n=1 Tax=Desmophyllum pertusum TaxID=174260 RepID=A0A9W9YGC6_9CNID|nr:hypothetical protein OS493_014646 [Desmophyllum pertusum]